MAKFTSKLTCPKCSKPVTFVHEPIPASAKLKAKKSGGTSPKTVKKQFFLTCPDGDVCEYWIDIPVED